MKSILLVLLASTSFLFFPLTSYSQYDTRRIMEMISRGSEQELAMESAIMIQEGYLYQAGLIVDKLLEMKPQSSDYNYRKGFVLLEMSSDFTSALPYLEIAVKNTNKRYDPFSANNMSAPIDAFFELGKCHHMAGNIDQAEANFNKFIETSISKSNNIFFAKLYLEQCKVARNEMSNPKNVELKNVGSVINTKNPEFSPVISLDGSALYFTSRRRWPNGASDKGLDPRNNLYPEDIYVSYKDFDSTWMMPVRLEFCDSLQNEATLAVSPDERRVYVYQDTKGNGDIFYSDFSTNRFQQVTHIPNKKLNSDSWETHITVAPDGQTLYFVSDRPGGYGGRDIYMCQKKEDGKWSDPVNMGPAINGPMDEESPFVSVDNSTLYFSSNGNKSMGGFDVFMSKLGADGKWTQAVNLGYPINSTCDDLFYTTTIDGLTGYITSVRADGMGEKDIYEIKNNYLGVKNIAVLNGKINVVGGKPIPEDVYITLKCTDCEKPYLQKVYPRIRDGVFMSSLEPCKNYEIAFSFEKEDVRNFHVEQFTTECSKQYSEVYKEFWLDIEKKMMIQPHYIVGTITDIKTNEKLSDVTITLTEKETGKLIYKLNTKANGAYKTDTLSGVRTGSVVNYSFKLEKDGYLALNYDYPVSFGENPETVVDHQMTRIEKGTDLGKFINPIYFDYNKWNIRPDAAIELDKIVKIMQENPDIKIELGSHTDSRGSDAANLTLSDKRAKSSAAYIVSKGIPDSRITGKGYGEQKLIVSDKEIENMTTTEEKEKAHQLNRRTEFLIVQ